MFQLVGRPRLVLRQAFGLSADQHLVLDSDNGIADLRFRIITDNLEDLPDLLFGQMLRDRTL